MSHFLVAVITKENPNKISRKYGRVCNEVIDSVMAPYNEEIVMDKPHVYATKDQIIGKIRRNQQDYRESEIYAEYHKDPEKYAKEHSDTPGHVAYLREGFDKECQKTDEELYQEYIRSIECDDGLDSIGPNGEHMTRLNPKAKWDWWTIGGRWNGELPVMFDDGTVRGRNMAEVSCVKWKQDKTMDEYKKEHPEEVEEYNQMISGKGVWHSESYAKKRWPSLDDYIDENMQFQTYAVLSPSGENGEYEWHEAGTVGWFGSTSASPEEEREFKKDYYERYIKPFMEGKYWVTIVDCHI